MTEFVEENSPEPNDCDMAGFDPMMYFQVQAAIERSESEDQFLYDSVALMCGETHLTKPLREEAIIDLSPSQDHYMVSTKSEMNLPRLKAPPSRNDYKAELQRALLLNSADPFEDKALNSRPSDQDWEGFQIVRLTRQEAFAERCKMDAAGLI